tara:strand:+ start:886 stop:1452 length:567 start_codon:yes stop_codon:yes gene_type:complete
MSALAAVWAHPRLSHSRFLPIDKLDLDSFAKEKTAPGELALVKFLRMLDHICHDAPGKNLHFEPNADILRPVRPQIQPGFEIDRCISSRPQKPPPGRKNLRPPHLMAPETARPQIRVKSPPATPHGPQHRRLTVNHLGVIVGETIARERAEQLIPLITKSPFKSTNLCWITNRQQVPSTAPGGAPVSS